jgi:hypothetical protein
VNYALVLDVSTGTVSFSAYFIVAETLIFAVRCSVSCSYCYYYCFLHPNFI